VYSRKGDCCVDQHGRAGSIRPWQRYGCGAVGLTVQGAQKHPDANPDSLNLQGRRLPPLLLRSERIQQTRREKVDVGSINVEKFIFSPDLEGPKLETRTDAIRRVGAVIVN